MTPQYSINELKPNIKRNWYYCDLSVKRPSVEISLKNQNFHGRVGPLTQEFKQTGINRV